MVSNNICGGRALRIAVGITVLAILLLAGSASALSNSGGGSWSYNKDIIITNSGNALTEYQVLVDLNGDKFPINARSDGADIRFTDNNGNELSYWIESWDYAGRSAKVWVKVPNIAGGGSATIRMYYGNPMAVSAGNGVPTFVFFDDFNAGNLDRWSTEGLFGAGAPIVSNKYLEFWGSTSDAYTHMWADWTENVKYFEANFKAKHPLNGLDANYHINFIVNKSSNDDVNCNAGEYYYRLRFYGSTSPSIYRDNLDKCVNGQQTPELIYFGYNSIPDWKEMKVIVNESGVFVGIGSTYYSTSDTRLNNFDRIYLMGYNTVHKYFDDIRIRKYASPEPSVSVGAEVPNVVENFTIAHLTDVHIGYTPWEPIKKSEPLSKYFLNKETLMKNSVETFTDTLQDIKIASPDRVLITGDLVEYNDKDFFMAFKNLLRGFSIPVNTTPGNHDRRYLVIKGNDISNYNNYINKNINNLTNPDDNNYYFDFKGYRFIGLDSGADYSENLDLDKTLYDITPEAEGLSDNQMQRLRDDFNNSAPKIVFMHHPVMSFEDDALLKDPILEGVLFGVPPDGGPGGNNGAIAFNRWNFINYSEDNNIQLVLTGHRHADAIFDVTGRPVDNSSPSRPLFIQTRMYGYRIVEVKNGKANPYNSAPIPRFERNSSALTLKNIYLAQFGLHAYDSLKRHTGMIGCSDDFELGIPDSYYTGNYGGKSFTPEVIVGYSKDTVIGTEITEFKIFSSCKPFVSNAVKSVSSIQTSPSENISFNQTIEKQNDRFTTEINFYDINITKSSITTVNISNLIYKMELDLDGDGTTDKTINPDSIDTILAQPQNNIDVITYNGAGTINLITGSGNFTKASSLNPLLLTGKPPYKFPYGIFGFNISGLNRGQTIGITITLPRNISSAAQYWKYGSTPDTPLPHWYQIPLGSNDGDNVITIQLQDGGVGDDDMTANGIILDAGGPAIPIAGKVTGEGWIVSPITPAPKNNNKATFEFTASYAKGKTKGNIEYTDHAAGVKFHGTVTTLSVDKEANAAAFSGIAEINGAKYAYTVIAVDNGKHGKTDTFSINIPAISYMSSGIVGGGNIQIHKDKIEDKDELEDKGEIERDKPS